MEQHSKKHSQKPLYGIILAFMTPIILAHFLYHSGYGKHNHRSKGTLLTPPIKIDAHTKKNWQVATLSDPNEHKEKFNTLTKRWQALGKDQKRVQLTVLQNQKKKQIPMDNWNELILETKTLNILKQSKSKDQLQCALFIINPNNDVILCYDQKNPLKDIDMDLRKLLKLSRE